MKTAGTNLIEMRRVFQVAQERLFEAWTDPEVVMRWWGFWDESDAPTMEIELEVGGRYRFAMSVDGETSWVTGVYTEIVRPERLAFTFAWEGQEGPETPVILEFRGQKDGTTELILTHDVSRHVNACVEGWESQFQELETFLAGV